MTSFLTQTEDPRALAWADEWSSATEAKAQHDANYEKLRERIEAALNSDERIPFVLRRGEYLYNFWRDKTNPRGLWRRITLAGFRAARELAAEESKETQEAPTQKAEPWEVLLDVDKLAAEEGEQWVWKGAHVLSPDNDRALLRLSRGGADATVIREFDLSTRRFVTEEPFELPEAKSDVSWVNRDCVLVGTDTGEGSLTSSGYPAQVRVWQRGAAFTQAPLYTQGSPDDVAVGAWVDRTPGEEKVVVTRAIDFYSTRVSLALGSDLSTDLHVLEVPEDCEVSCFRSWLIFNPRTDWAGIPGGGVGVINTEAFLSGSRSIQVLFRPSDQVSLNGLRCTRNFLLLTLLDTVRTRLEVHDLRDLSAPPRALDLPQMVTANIVATSALDGDELWLSTSSFTQPDSLYRADLAHGLDLELFAQAPALFDASGITTIQHWATSADGTRLPYFITGRFGDEKKPSPRPTLIGGYGGFEVSLTPGYSAVQGIAWLERGYYLVQPNLRGGGEFGPRWHSQVQKTKRHKVWEDHRAVLEDVEKRGYARPADIAIRGGSNGGLLTAGALNRYPQAFGAAIVQVPLTDMLRYHTWLAGASWMAEYGDPAVAEERAALEAYSPLHNITPTADCPYPPALVTTSTRDDRVHPAHARLFAAALRENGHVVDYFENTEGGHAGAADNAQVARVEALIYSWLNQNLELGTR